MISVLDYGMGNVGSIVNMLKSLGEETRFAAKPEDIISADKLILPGVGTFDQGMQRLHDRGFTSVLNSAVLERKMPILGICLGVQLFTRGSQEGAAPGLGWIAADTIRFQFEESDNQLKVPHMGWNRIEPARADPLLRNLPPDPRFYFAHSYYIACDEAADVLAWTTHGHRFASVIGRGNIWGTQFHPEKSHKYGLALLRNFAAI
jgi:glutamine amidotransferase